MADHAAPGRAFDRALLARPTLEAAHALLGARLVRDDASGRRVGRIVELEAYVGMEDRASHARFGPTARNAVMFGPPGIAYVYLVYGMYHCLNVVSEGADRAAALLVRAVAPLEGEALMRADRLAHARAHRRWGALALGSPGRTAEARRVAEARRLTEARRLAALPLSRVASGPGLVGAAYGLDRSWTGQDLCDPRSALHLEEAPAGAVPPTILATPRIGIAYAGEPWTSQPWRFVIAGDPALSGSGHRSGRRSGRR